MCFIPGENSIAVTICLTFLPHTSRTLLEMKFEPALGDSRRRAQLKALPFLAAFPPGPGLA